MQVTPKCNLGGRIRPGAAILVSQIGVIHWTALHILHIPVMVREVLDALQVRSDGEYIDCTVGEGGHSVSILGAAPEARLLGIDLDPGALAVSTERLSDDLHRAVLVQRSFANIADIARERGFEAIDGVIFDLGLSSRQVDEQARGFSFRQEARLDMRFDQAQGLSAYEVVNDYRERDLSDIIRQLGEEPWAGRIARAIVRSRPVESTTQLAELVARASGRSRRGRTHPATRTFQAIRMAVNKELENLQRGLDGALDILDRSGRLVVISYHSLEDRLVKSTLRREASDCICPAGTPQCVCGHTATIRLVNRRVIKPTSDEIKANPRSRSARMRVAERI